VRDGNSCREAAEEEEDGFRRLRNMTVPVEDGEAVGVAVGDGDEVDTRRMHSSIESCVLIRPL